MIALFVKHKRQKQKTWINHCSHERGMAMVIILAASAIAALTTMAIAMRAYNGYVNGAKQSLADRAKEAAEAGLNILIESLNQDHPEWLIEPYNGDGDWTINRGATGGCRTNIGNNPTIEGTSNTYDNGTEGRYRLVQYSFHGNNFYGGVGSFEMEGELRSSENKLLASAKVYQDMSIITKRCDELPGENTDEDSIWPGIYIDNKLRRYKNVRSIVKGTEPEKAARILCGRANCGMKPRSGGRPPSGWSSEYPPWPPKQGDIEMPRAQEPPENLDGMSISDFEEEVNTKLSTCEPFIIPDDLPEQAKQFDEENGTWHTYITGRSKINIEGNSACEEDPYSDAIKISGDHPIRLHIEGSIAIEQDTWIDTTDVDHAADFMILATPRAKEGHKLDLVGSSPNEEAMKAFIWLPRGETKLHAVSGEKRVIEGAIWSNKIWAEGNALLGTTDIVVPQDMPQLVYQRLGKEFGIGQRDYVAQGVSSWRSYGRTPD